MEKTANFNNHKCPCGSNIPYSLCCQKYLENGKYTTNAEILMRSRYTAYVMSNEAYLLATWHILTRPKNLALNKNKQLKWIKLEIKNYQILDDNHATVEFIAYYKINGKMHKMHEISQFIKENDQWFYVKGTTSES